MKYHLKKMGQAGSRNLQIKRTSGHRKIQKCQRRNGVFSVWLHKCRSNKKGEEMVEASIVLPILILTILSLILLNLYYYACLNCQVELHGELISDTENRKAVFKVVEKRETVSSEVGGVISMIMQKEIAASAYAIGPADMIRAGELIGLE